MTTLEPKNLAVRSAVKIGSAHAELVKRRGFLEVPWRLHSELSNDQMLKNPWPSKYRTTTEILIYSILQYYTDKHKDWTQPWSHTDTVYLKSVFNGFICTSDFPKPFQGTAAAICDCGTLRVNHSWAVYLKSICSTAPCWSCLKSPKTCETKNSNCKLS